MNIIKKQENDGTISIEITDISLKVWAKNEVDTYRALSEGLLSFVVQAERSTGKTLEELIKIGLDKI